MCVSELFVILLQDVKLSSIERCPYLQNEVIQQEYFFAEGLGYEELDLLLSAGWRKFGRLYFRYSCPFCRRCVPLRVPVRQFFPSKSQRRVLKKNSDVNVSFRPLSFSLEMYRIYCDHSRRFNSEINDIQTFTESFITESCPSFQSEYRICDMFFAAGFLDRSARALSSVYFFFDTSFSYLSPGTFSVLREIDYACELGLEYYYLGYWNNECLKTVYKKNFRPFELMDWNDMKWRLVE